MFTYSTILTNSFTHWILNQQNLYHKHCNNLKTLIFERDIQALSLKGCLPLKKCNTDNTFSKHINVIRCGFLYFIRN